MSAFKKLLKILAFLFSSVFVVLSSSQTIRATAPHLNVLLSDQTYMEVLEPSSISYTYKIRPAKNFGIPFSQQYYGIKMTIGEPYHGCSHLRNEGSLEDSVVFIQRGECSFMTKTLNAQAAGALAIVIADNDLQNDQNFIDMVDDGTHRLVEIPAVFLLGKDGHMIKNSLDSLHRSYAIINIPVNLTGQPIHYTNQPPWSLW